GTYPFHGGGVSVWCDQLVRGLPEHQFHVIAVTSNGGEAKAWDLPDNVTQLTRVPVWGPVRSVRRASQMASRHFREAHRGFVDSVVNPDAPDAVAQLVAALQTMSAHARKANLSAALLSNEALTQLS